MRARNIETTLKNETEHLKEMLDSVYRTIYLANISTVDTGEEDRTFNFVETRK